MKEHGPVDEREAMDFCVRLVAMSRGEIRALMERARNLDDAAQSPAVAHAVAEVLGAIGRVNR